MPSPFPGMDPYLEDSDVWPEYHGEFIYKIRKHVASALPPQFLARVDRHVYVTEPGEKRTLIGKPDALVVESNGAAGNGVATATLAAPMTVGLPPIVRRSNRLIRILDRESHQVVTVIELLSPSNKRSGEDRDAYLAKRREYLASGLNLVEIDLLRGGQRMPVDVPPAADYFILVSRSAEYPLAGGWPIGVREPLPTIPIPLGPGVQELTIDLAAPFREAYDDGHYGRNIDYSHPPVPPLREPDATWARELLAAHNPQR